MHPGRCADVYIGSSKLGTIGEMHPNVASEYGFAAADRIYLAELDFDVLFENVSKTKDYVPLPKYPSINRDFSFVCPEDLEVGTIEECIKSASGKLAESISLFDVYRGANLQTGTKSVSFNVVLRSNDHTLTVEEADKVSNKILSAVEHKLGITIRK